jgi:hypothetical protein
MLLDDGWILMEVIVMRMTMVAADYDKEESSGFLSDQGLLNVGLVFQAEDRRGDWIVEGIAPGLITYQRKKICYERMIAYVK